MLAVLVRETAGRTVRPVRSTFGDFAADRPYDLLYAAASWHWTDPDTRWTHAAELVRPGGTVALFGSGGSVRTLLTDPDLRAAFDEVRRGLLDDNPHPTGRRSSTGQWWPGTELEQRDEFSDLVDHDLARTIVRSREDFLGQITTTSTYLQLSPPDRAELRRRTSAVLPADVTVEASLRLHLARRR